MAAGSVASAEVTAGQIPIALVHHEFADPSAPQRSGQPVVVEVAMRDEQTPNVRERMAGRVQPRVQRVEHVVGLPAGVDECQAVVVFDQIAVDVAQRIAGHREAQLHDAVAVRCHRFEPGQNRLRNLSMTRGFDTFVRAGPPRR